MVNFLEIFSEKELFDLCYCNFLTGIMDDNGFYSDELLTKYDNLETSSKVKLDKILDKIVKRNITKFKMLEKVDRTGNDDLLNELQKELLEKIILDFRVISKID